MKQEELDGLGAPELARLTGAHPATARRWVRLGRVPEPVRRLLSMLRRDDLGAYARAWRGWRVISSDGTHGHPRGDFLVSPEGTYYSPGDVRVSRMEHVLAHETRGALEAASSRAIESAERLERSALLASVHNAQAAAAKAIEALADALDVDERDVFDRLDTTREARERYMRGVAEDRAEGHGSIAEELMRNAGLIARE